MNGNTKEIKYTLAREEMIELLEKYPFLVYRNIYSGVNVKCCGLRFESA